MSETSNSPDINRGSKQSLNVARQKFSEIWCSIVFCNGKHSLLNSVISESAGITHEIALRIPCVIRG